MPDKKKPKQAPTDDLKEKMDVLRQIVVHRWHPGPGTGSQCNYMGRQKHPGDRRAHIGHG